MGKYAVSTGKYFVPTGLDLDLGFDVSPPPGTQTYKWDKVYSGGKWVTKCVDQNGRPVPDSNCSGSAPSNGGGKSGPSAWDKFTSFTSSLAEGITKGRQAGKQQPTYQPPAPSPSLGIKPLHLIVGGVAIVGLVVLLKRRK